MVVHKLAQRSADDTLAQVPVVDNVILFGVVAVDIDDLAVAFVVVVDVLLQLLVDGSYINDSYKVHLIVELLEIV